MTAYVSADYSYKGYVISCDIKSVNGKSLDVNLKSNFLNPKIDLELKELVSKKAYRGTLEININADLIENKSFTLNKKLIKEIKEELNNSDLDIKNLSFSDIKDIPNIFIENKKISLSGNLIKRVFKDTLKSFIKSKELEGRKIKKTFVERLKKINKHSISLSKQTEKNKQKRKNNILSKLNLLNFNGLEDSVSNEVVNQIIKSDISEEIDRLSFHKSSLHDELESKKAKGKKIDFILLEMLREINTILAKVTFNDEKSFALNIKILIEEMREQVSNVE